MRLTIFWRVIFAQLTLIALLLVVSLYARFHLHQLAHLSTDILVTDSTSIEAEKRLLKIFLQQVRSAEKYLLLRDKMLYGHFTAGSSDFTSALAQVEARVSTSEERAWLVQIRELYSRYATGLSTAFASRSTWNQEKTEISDGITGRINELIRFREETIARKTAAARDQAALAAQTVVWLSLGSILAAVLLAYVHARGMSRPLKNLALALRRVGQGALPAALDVRAPAEVRDLLQAFNWMATELAELDRMKADFIAHVSHELRTPLTGIREGTALLLEQIPGTLTTAQQQILEVVRNHSTRLAQHISSLLDLSKMEAGMLEYVWAPGDLAILIERSLEAVQLAARNKQLHLEVLCASPLPMLWVDAGRIQQVLDNLLSNAVKFTPAGGTIRVKASVQKEREDQSCVEIRVCDSGKGIPVEDLERIFDRFYQSADHRQASQQGTGLGLTIARHIVEAHGGKIWAESRHGEGATLACTLPINRRDTGVELTYPAGRHNGVRYEA